MAPGLREVEDYELPGVGETIAARVPWRIDARRAALLSTTCRFQFHPESILSPDGFAILRSAVTRLTTVHSEPSTSIRAA